MKLGAWNCFFGVLLLMNTGAAYALQQPMNLREAGKALVDSTIATNAGRIGPKPPNDPGRCLGQGLSAEVCKAMQDSALQMGCVTPGEHLALVRYGYAPACSPLRGTGLEQLINYCPCGCFHPETLISVHEWASGDVGEIEAGELISGLDEFGLIHLSSDARRSSFTQAASPILITTKGKEERDLVVITTVSGRVLKLTEQHAVLTSGGIMKAAVDIAMTDKLVRKNGEEEAITHLDRESFAGEVVNFTVDARDPKEHIIFAEDLAVGDLLWQSSLSDLKSQIAVRQ